MLPCEGEYQRPGLRCRLSVTPQSSHCSRGVWVLIRGQNHSPNGMRRGSRSLLNDREVQFKPLPEVFWDFFFHCQTNRRLTVMTAVQWRCALGVCRTERLWGINYAGLWEARTWKNPISWMPSLGEKDLFKREQEVVLPRWWDNHQQENHKHNDLKVHSTSVLCLSEAKSTLALAK